MRPDATQPGKPGEGDERWFRSDGENEPMVLFHAAGRGWSVDDAIEAAIHRGEGDALRRILRVRLAAVQAAADANWEPADDALQEASDQLRYERNLISAEDAESWLEARNISIDRFSDWIYQSVCLEAFPEPGEAAADEDEDLATLLRTHLWLSGEMDRLSSELARRLGASLRLAAESGLAEAPLDFSSLDDAWKTLRSRALTDEQRSRELATGRLALTRLEVESLEFDSEEPAREAVLCATGDGMTLSEVAASSGFRALLRDIWLDEPLDPRMLAARDGAVIGPISGEDGGFHVHRVIRRNEPLLNDPLVIARLDATIERRLVDDLCLQFVRGLAPAEA